jgi:hypothetical protein
MILVPIWRFNMFGLDVSGSLIAFAILLNFIFQYKIKKKVVFDFKIINPFLFLYISLLILSIFEWNMPWEIQFTYWIKSFYNTCIIPFILWNIKLYNPKIVAYIKYSLIISILIAGLYGIFLMKLGGLNPYTSFLANYFDSYNDFADLFSTKSTRLDFSSASKIQSTMIHPMHWALILCFFLVVFVSSLKRSSKSLYIYILLIGLLGFNIIISGVRTAIASVLIGFSYFLFRNRNYKLILYSFVVISIGIFIITLNSDLSNIFVSFIDIDGSKSSIRGSSISFRLDQFDGVLYEIKDNPLVGKGYGWSQWYTSTFGAHSTIHSFESLIFMVLCNHGVIGLAIWGIFFSMLFILNRQLPSLIKSDKYFLDVFVIVYLSYIIGTGEYGYLSFFAILYTFFICNLIEKSYAQKS